MQPTQDPTPITYAVKSDEHADKLHAVFVALGYAPVRIESKTLTERSPICDPAFTIVEYCLTSDKSARTLSSTLRTLDYWLVRVHPTTGSPVRLTLAQLAVQINLTTRELLIAEALQAGTEHCNLNEATGLQSRTCTWLVRSLLVKASVSRVEKFLELLRAPAISGTLPLASDKPTS